ncbi:MAG TPA: acetate--CoA ligase family protein [Puia sp.]|nr:acetate--CoA ligase family protein [Puia sp.]
MLEDEVYQWLAGAGIPVPEYRCFSLNEDLAAASWPVALKIMSLRIVHKTDMGGVALYLNDRQQLVNARESILYNLEQKGFLPDAHDRWIVTRMYRGIELFFGIIRDPVFGKVILFGAGGTMVEIFKDVCYIDSEAPSHEMERAILSTRIGQIFVKGFRGRKYDIRPVIDMITRLQQLDVQELDCNPVILSAEGLAVVDARALMETTAPPTAPDSARTPFPHSGNPRNIPQIFDPGRVAIIGASGSPGKVGYALARNSAGDPDCSYVNPHLDELFGKKVYKGIECLPAVDTAVLCIPSASVRESIEKLAAKGVKNIIVITAGFREAGQDETFLEELCSRHGIHIIGPNCLGVYAHGKNLTFGPGTVNAGDVNVFSQSGAILAELMDKANYKGIGFENIISTGNMADVDFADCICSYSGTHPVNLYIEGIAHGKNLLRAIRASKVPVRIFKAGRTDAAKKAAFSHTGNLAGNFEMFEGLVRGAGATIIRDINGLLYPHHLQRVLVITNAGGAGTVFSDMISDKLYSLNPAEVEALSAVLPDHWSKNNPIDIIGDATHERYLRTLAVADTFGADAIFVLVTPQFMTDTAEIGAIFCNHKFKTRIFPVMLGGEKIAEACSELRAAGLPWFEELTEAASFL